MKKKKTKIGELQKAKKKLIQSVKDYHTAKEYHDYKIINSKLKQEVQEWKDKYELLKKELGK